jgi:hypothetical protein
MKTALIISLALFLLPLTYLGKDAASEFLAVDSCLDSGGSYDYNKKGCDKKGNYIYIPYGKRKTALILSCSSISIIGLISIMRARQKRK